MKSSNQHILETLIINKDYRDASISPKSFYELRKIIVDRYFKLGPGTKKDPIDFNDVDVSNLDSFCGEYDKGLFEGINFKYIDISYWDVSNVKSMRHMFYDCEELESIGDISKWDVSNVTDMNRTFLGCKSFNQDISGWDVSNVTNMEFMFYGCKYFNQDLSSWDVLNVTDMGSMFQDCISFNKNLSNWDVSKVINMINMFYGCESFNQDISGWDVSKVQYKTWAFLDCPIKEEYKPKFK